MTGAALGPAWGLARRGGGPGDPVDAGPADRQDRAVTETSQTLDRGLRVLELLAESGSGATVTEIAATLGVGRAVVYRLLATLEQHGLVRRGDDDARVRLGLGVLQLSRRVQPLLREAALPVLRRLAEELGATAHLTVVDGGEALAVAVVEPSWTDLHVAYRVGSRHPLDRGAAGRAILAARAGDTGVVVSGGELQVGAQGVAAPVTGVPAVEASVGVVALAALDLATVGPRVRAAAEAVSAALR
jgi:DNA-binding IclR family transcriptional regulator